MNATLCRNVKQHDNLPLKCKHVLNCFTYNPLLQLAMQVIRTGSAGAYQERLSDVDNTIKTHIIKAAEWSLLVYHENQNHHDHKKWCKDIVLSCCQCDHRK